MNHQQCDQRRKGSNDGWSTVTDVESCGATCSKSWWSDAGKYAHHGHRRRQTKDISDAGNGESAGAARDEGSIDSIVQRRFLGPPYAATTRPSVKSMQSRAGRATCDDQQRAPATPRSGQLWLEFNKPRRGGSRASRSTSAVRWRLRGSRLRRWSWSEIWAVHEGWRRQHVGRAVAQSGSHVGRWPLLYKRHGRHVAPVSVFTCR